MNKTTKYAILAFGLAFITATGCKKDDPPPTVPTVTTAALTNITTTGATGGGTITSNGGSAITASGIVLSRKNTTPTLSDTVINATATSGSFTVNVTNLDFGTTYYIRAYATNAVGTSYGDVVTLSTTNDDTKVRFTYDGQEVTYGIITSSTTGKKWMDRNLGASRVATSITDDQAYGDLIQWGRLIDGHQKRNSTTTDVLSTTDVPGHNKFITVFSSPTLNWRNPPNPNLWQGSAGINNPCPSGWHVPTKAEWDAELTGITNLNTAFSVLKLLRSGYRWLDGSLGGADFEGDYWSSDVAPGGPSWTFYIDGSKAVTTGYDPGHGLAVRCIKD